MWQRVVVYLVTPVEFFYQLSEMIASSVKECIWRSGFVAFDTQGAVEIVLPAFVGFGCGTGSSRLGGAEVSEQAAICERTGGVVN